MNRPAKGYNPGAPFFAVRAKSASGVVKAKALTGPVELFQYEGGSGVKDASNPGLPTFRQVSFDAGYPFGVVNLSDPGMPVKARIKGWNPFIPTDPDSSGLPVAVLVYEITNTSAEAQTVTVCGTLQNFIGNDGTKSFPTKNRNAFRKGAAVQGVFMTSDTAKSEAEQWGTMALAVPSSEDATCRTAWLAAGWGTPLLDFWDDLTDDGRMTERAPDPTNGQPRASLAVQAVLPPGAVREFPFLIAWHFPNRYAWSEKRLGNHYTTRFADAWDAAEKVWPRLPALESETAAFAAAFIGSDIPAVVKEAALFNLSTLRTQTCFRTEDGRFYAWEGCGDKEGCCWGSCTHVWNYEQAVAFLFGGIARSLREVEFGPQTDPATGLMSFRWKLPLEETPWGKAAADGQMGCILKMYRDWQLAGDAAFLKAYWPKVRKAVEFCWIPGGWDADKDGVMEGCQHNTMDVEYYGPNPQMGLWYLGALRAAEEMAKAVGRRRVRLDLPPAVRQRQPLDRRQPVQRPLLCPQGRPAQERGRHRAGPPGRHGCRRHLQAGLPAGRGLSGRPARRPAPGPCRRPGLSGQAREHPDHPGLDPQVQPARLAGRPLQRFAHIRARGRGRAPHGRLSRRPAGQSLPLLHRGHDRVRIHGGHRHALRGDDRGGAADDRRHPGPL